MLSQYYLLTFSGQQFRHGSSSPVIGHMKPLVLACCDFAYTTPPATASGTANRAAQIHLRIAILLIGRVLIETATATALVNRQIVQGLAAKGP
jgi:hypothetical protein